jgi:hypothetical protein
MGLGDLLEEVQELHMGMPVVAGVRADASGGHLQRGEQRGGAMPRVVVGLTFGKSRS